VSRLALETTQFYCLVGNRGCLWGVKQLEHEVDFTLLPDGKVKDALDMNSLYFLDMMVRNRDSIDLTLKVFF
jgi:hypothetical protein